MHWNANFIWCHLHLHCSKLTPAFIPRFCGTDWDQLIINAFESLFCLEDVGKILVRGINLQKPEMEKKAILTHSLPFFRVCPYSGNCWKIPTPNPSTPPLGTVLLLWGWGDGVRVVHYWRLVSTRKADLSIRTSRANHLMYSWVVVDLCISLETH